MACVGDPGYPGLANVPLIVVRLPPHPETQIKAFFNKIFPLHNHGSHFFRQIFLTFSVFFSFPVFLMFSFYSKYGTIFVGFSLLLTDKFP